jgi:hypothetical protein
MDSLVKRFLKNFKMIKTLGSAQTRKGNQFPLSPVRKALFIKKGSKAVRFLAGLGGGHCLIGQDIPRLF